MVCPSSLPALVLRYILMAESIMQDSNGAAKRMAVAMSITIAIDASECPESEKAAMTLMLGEMVDALVAAYNVQFSRACCGLVSQ